MLSFLSVRARIHTAKVAALPIQLRTTALGHASTAAAAAAAEEMG